MQIAGWGRFLLVRCLFVKLQKWLFMSALVAFLIGAAESLKTCLSEGYGIISCVCFGRHRVIVVILKE